MYVIISLQECPEYYFLSKIDPVSDETEPMRNMTVMIESEINMYTDVKLEFELRNEIAIEIFDIDGCQ